MIADGIINRHFVEIKMRGAMSTPRLVSNVQVLAKAAGLTHYGLVEFAREFCAKMLLLAERHLENGQAGCAMILCDKVEYIINDGYGLANDAELIAARSAIYEKARKAALENHRATGTLNSPQWIARHSAP